jgi:hypothetical protein
MFKAILITGFCIEHPKHMERTFSRSIQLPFVPQVGMLLTGIGLPCDKLKIIEVDWNHEEGQFEISLEDFTPFGSTCEKLSAEWEDCG